MKPGDNGQTTSAKVARLCAMCLSTSRINGKHELIFVSTQQTYS